MPNKNPKASLGSLSVGAIVCSALGVIALAASVIMIIYTEYPPIDIAVTALCTYGGAVIMTAVIAALRRRTSTGDSSELRGSIFGTISLNFIQKLYSPVLICDEIGKIVWYNTSLSSRFRTSGVLYGKQLDTICNTTIENIIEDNGNGIEITFSSASEVAEGEAEVFLAKGYRVASKGKVFYITIFDNVTNIKKLNDKLKEEDTIIAYAMIDNLDELMQYVQELYANAANDVEAILRSYMEKVGGVLRVYGHNKYMCVFTARHLRTFIAERFSMLDEIREIHVGDTTMPVTISMGISASSGSLYEKERATQAALDMALQRGGDQVVVKTDDGVEFYGGKSKTVQKRTKVRARVIANELIMLISSSENVIVMGHRFADFDALASCLAVVRLCKFCGVRAYIVVDKNAKNLAGCFDRLGNNPEYENLFVDKLEAQDLIHSSTLGVAVDVNNMDYCEAPDVIRTVQNIVVIDHHRKTAEFANRPKIAYIEPSASSASELMSEFLEQILPQGTLPKVEADLLLAGMLLDTKYFTHNTGVRTFSSALYLRGEGASPIDAKSLFKMDIEDFLSEAKFESNVVIYKSVIAIALNENDSPTTMGHINAARAADRLLNVEGVLAAFALCRIGDTVHISARSQGRINVQLILEKMGGGGHFDSAGAQMKNSSVANTLTLLRAAIDEYLDESK